MPPAEMLPLLDSGIELEHQTQRHRYPAKTGSESGPRHLPSAVLESPGPAFLGPSYHVGGQLSLLLGDLSQLRAVWVRLAQSVQDTRDFLKGQG